MELFTVGYEGRTLPQFVRLLKENEIVRLVDVRERPASRKRGFSAVPLFDAMRKVGITYESDRALGNPIEVRDLWKNGSLAEGKARYRRMIRNGRRPRVELLLAHAKVERVCILCFEGDPDVCHRGVIAEEAARLEPDLVIHHL
ncbi:MAG: DUF488 domain-containing protein [Actinomycetota bacterium]